MGSEVRMAWPRLRGLLIIVAGAAMIAVGFANRSGSVSAYTFLAALGAVIAIFGVCATVVPGISPLSAEWYITKTEGK